MKDVPASLPRVIALKVKADLCTAISFSLAK